MRADGRGPGGKLGPPPCAHGAWGSGGAEPEPNPTAPEPAAPFPEEPEAPRCDLCGGEMLDRHCKLVCRSCGYQRDCSDP